MRKTAREIERALMGGDYPVVTDDTVWRCKALSLGDALAQWSESGQSGEPVAVCRAGKVS